MQFKTQSQRKYQYSKMIFKKLLLKSKLPIENGSSCSYYFTTLYLSVIIDHNAVNEIFAWVLSQREPGDEAMLTPT